MRANIQVLQTYVFGNGIINHMISSNMSTLRKTCKHMNKWEIHIL